MSQLFLQLLVASQIHDFFVSITEHFDPLVPIESSPNVIPDELFVSEREVLSGLSKLDTKGQLFKQSLT